MTKRHKSGAEAEGVQVRDFAFWKTYLVFLKVFALGLLILATVAIVIFGGCTAWCFLGGCEL